MSIPPAFAETATHSSFHAIASAMPQILLVTGFISLFYLWRQQAKRQQEKQALLIGLRVGDVVYTHGGIVGKITQLHEGFYQIEVGVNVRIYIQKEAVADLVPKGSLKALGFK